MRGFHSAGIAQKFVAIIGMMDMSIGVPSFGYMAVCVGPTPELSIEPLGAPARTGTCGHIDVDCTDRC
jgi:hypothetical protein